MNTSTHGSFTGHYVYNVYVNDNVVYVGKGVGQRYMHPISGKSSCSLLNRDFFNGENIKVICTHNNLTKSEVSEIEKIRIADSAYVAQVEGRQFYNVQGVS